MEVETKQPLISVIIPVYNVEKYVRQCLDSVINQTYRNLEILVVDDGSTDGSGEICDDYKDERITVFHTENRGLSAARNYAIDRATGDYIAFLDSDDWLELDAYQKLVHAAMENDADIVAFNIFQEYVNRTVECQQIKDEFILESEEILRAVHIEHKISDDVWDKFYKADLFDSIRYPDGKIFEDKATTYKLLQKARKLAYIPDCLIHYRNRNNSISNDHSMKSLVDYWLAYKDRFETLGSTSEEYYKQSLSDCISAISRMWRWYAGCPKEEKREAKSWLCEMQQFVKEHEKEIKVDPFYSRYVKTAVSYTRYQNPLIFKALYLTNGLYRKRNKDIYFDE